MINSRLMVALPFASSNLSSLELYKRTLTYLRPYYRLGLIALFCMVIFGATDGGVPLLLKHILDGVFVSKDTKLLAILPALLIAFALLRAVCDFGQQYLLSKVGLAVVRDMRDQVHANLVRLDPHYFVRHSSAELVSTLTADVLLVRSLLTDSVAAILRDCVRVIVLLVISFYIDPTLALISFVLMPIGFYPVYRFGRKIRSYSRAGQQAIAALSALTQESALGIRVVKIFGREKYEATRFSAKNTELTQMMLRSEKVRALSGPINEVLAMCAICAVLMYGGYSVVSGHRTQGEFIAFLTSVFLLYDPVKKLSRMSGSIQQGLVGAERLFNLIDAKPLVSDPAQAIKLGVINSVSFRNVAYNYPQSQQAALSGINLQIEAGSKVALVGLSGSGKSTLVDLVPRFIDPTQGEVFVAGVDVRRVGLEDLRSRISVVGQHTFLFNDTIYSNIAYGKPGATREEVYAAAKAAYAYDFIMQLPNTFDNIVGESGLALSGGERQRIAIARAVLKGAPILILDEATASLDNRAEREVQAAIDALTEGRTTIIIAHRLSTIVSADYIVVMKDGQIVETGKHAELLKNERGEYAKLYALQFRESNTASDEISLN